MSRAKKYPAALAALAGWLLAASFAPRAEAGNTCTWTGTWDTTPANTDDVIVVSSGGNLTWGSSLPATVASWSQEASYAGTVTVATVYPGKGAFTNFTITGDCTIQGGTWTHSANTGGQTNRLCVTINGNLTVTNATIGADGQGYTSGGPGGGSSVFQGTGGAYGGGSAGTAATNRSTYGSIISPADCGSQGGYAGGGAISLTVAGTTTVSSAGIISANGWGPGWDGRGSGGSVKLRTGWLTGSGTIRANGGTTSGGNGGSGGGGRVAIVLANGSFSTWTGTNTALGGTGAGYGSAGTVYRQATGVLDGAGTVIVDNGTTPTNASFTSLPALSNQTENLALSSWVVTNTTRLGLTTNCIIASLNLAKTTSTLELNGYTLNLSILTITNQSIGAGTWTAAQLGPRVTDRSGGAGRVIVSPPGVYVDDAGVTETTSGATNTMTFPIRVLGAVGTVSFDYYTTNDTAEAGADYVTATGSITVAYGIIATNVAVQIIGDDWIEPNETFRLVVTNVTGGLTALDPEGVGTVTNDDARTISIASAVMINPEGPSGTDTNAVFTVTLSQAIGTDVTFLYNTQDGTAVSTGTVDAGTYDYVPTNGTGTIKAGTTSTNVIIAVKGDNSNEGISENFQVVLTNPSANATLGTATGTCTIADDDGLPLMSVANTSVTEGDTGSTSAQFIVSVNKPSAGEITFNYRTVDGTATAPGDYTAVSGGSGSIPIGAQQTTVTVAVAGDYWIEPNETFEIQVYNLSNADPLDTNGVCTIVNDDYPFVWTGASNSLASRTNNWRWNGATATRLPMWGDAIVLDGAVSTSNLTWDAAASNTVASWSQYATYAGGTVTVATVYPGKGAFTNFTITGDCTISNGMWTHSANSGGETNRLCVTVGGNLVVANGATINADSCGYNQLYGPGYTNGYGAAHGGAGMGKDWALGNTNVYGSYNAPTNLGSGGELSSYDSHGGGAILLNVAGTTTVASASVITANGAGQGPSGGSVFLTTGWLTGAGGTIRANGGVATSGAMNYGGGGRVAIILTGANADFTTWGGTNTACGYNPGIAGKAGAGTVYRKTTAGFDELIIDNGVDGTATDYAYGQTATLLPGPVNLNSFSNVIIRKSGVLGIRGDTTVDFNTFAPAVSGPANSFIAIVNDANVTYPANWTITNYTLFPAGITKDLTNVTVAANGSISHYRNYTSETHRLNLTVRGNLTVNGKIDADSRGYAGGQGPAKGSTAFGGAYGGGCAGTASNLNTYGSVISPTNSGSGGNQGAGGGVISLTVAGTTTVSSVGMISANALQPGWDGAGSGGSVKLRTGWLTGSGTIRANGGNTPGGTGGSGGGGRVAVVLTGGNFSTWTGTNTALGGTAAGYGSAGTIYRQAAGDADGAGTVIVDNRSTPTNASFTSLPALLNKTEDLRLTSWVVTNTTRLGLTTNCAIASLNLSTTNSTLVLNGWTLTTKALTVTNKVYRSGEYTANDISRFSGNGKVVVMGAGMVLMVW